MVVIDNIHLAHSWVVSQYASDFNPWHHHSGDFSAVVYLKIPPNMPAELENDSKDHYPANGLIEFMFGENQGFRSDNLKFKPEVGKLLMFPSWLKHFVYPFVRNYSLSESSPLIRYKPPIKAAINNTDANSTASIKSVNKSIAK